MKSCFSFLIFSTMGCAGSKHEGDEALFLCKQRVRFIKQAIESRYALSAAQLSYTQSLRNVGVALRQFAECEALVESSLSTSEPDKTPSHSSYASPSPSRIVEHVSPPRLSGSPLSPRPSNMSYMKAAVSPPLKFTVDSSSHHFIEDDSLTFPFPPPPPPPPEFGFSWDFFDPTNATDNVPVPNGGSGINQNFSRLVGLNYIKESINRVSEEEVSPAQTNEELSESRFPNGNSFEMPSDSKDTKFVDASEVQAEKSNANGSIQALPRTVLFEPSGSKREKDEPHKEVCAAKEDASKFITHRAKDFVSSIKDIEQRFIKAAESGHEVSRMLETKKIRLNISSEIIGNPSASPLLLAFHLACCNAGSVTEHGTQQVTKVITWNRSISSCSSSSRIPLTSAVKEDGCESASDFIEEFCMISGSHLSTLDRLYAWEKKLYDEVKASESIRKAYDRKCAQLRHQFAKDMKAHVIDKTRATVKDLHSRVMVAIQAVNSISRRIERLRDEELQPQLLELIQGLIRMWKAMLECHHAQYITTSLAYHMKSSTTSQQAESYRQAITHLQNEIECFHSSFVNWFDAQKSYVGSLNAWLQKCILPSQERSWRRRLPFSPRRALAPPIFVLSGDWLAGINSLPSKEVSDSLKDLTSRLHDFYEQQREEKQEERKPEEADVHGEIEQKGGADGEKCEGNLSFLSLQTSLEKLFDQIAKFCEASAKVCENVKQGSELANDAYVNGVRYRFQQGVDAPL